MKKIVSLILCVSLLFALSACAELDAIRNTELPPLPTPEVKATEAPAPAEEEAAPEESRETPVPEIAVAEGDASDPRLRRRSTNSSFCSMRPILPAAAATVGKTTCCRKRWTIIPMFTTRGPN